jgi:hypothetical protein
MKRILMVLIASAALPLASVAWAQEPAKPAADPAAKPDCSTQKTAYDEAVTASKAKPDLTSCAEMKGKEKTECEKPLKDKGKEDVKAAKEKAKTAKHDLDCCKNPKKKGCAA